MKIGEKISKLRNSLGISQEVLAEKSGIDRGYLSRIENEHINPTHETLGKIAQALGGRFDFLAEKGNEPPPPPPDEIGPLTHNEKALILAYREIPTNDKRRAVMLMAKAFGIKQNSPP